LKDPCWSVFTIDGLELETSAYSGQLRWAIDHPGYLLPFHGFFEVKWSTIYGLGGKLSKMGHKLWFKMMLTFFSLPLSHGVGACSLFHWKNTSPSPNPKEKYNKFEERESCMLLSD
jgi:hypothetical protein